MNRSQLSGSFSSITGSNIDRTGINACTVKPNKAKNTNQKQNRHRPRPSSPPTPIPTKLNTNKNTPTLKNGSAEATTVSNPTNTNHNRQSRKRFTSINTTIKNTTGATKKTVICKPILKNNTYTNKTNTLSPPSPPRTLCHHKTNHTTNTVKNIAGAYTSASIVFDQYVSLNAIHKPATTPPTIPNNRPRQPKPPPNQPRATPPTTTYNNPADNAPVNTERKFTRRATSPNKGNKLNNRPHKIYNGEPGGCGIPNMCETAINSPQSQNEVDAAIVRTYTTNTTTNTNKAKTRLIIRPLSSFISTVRSFTLPLKGFSPPSRTKRSIWMCSRSYLGSAPPPDQRPLSPCAEPPWSPQKAPRKCTAP